MRMLGAMLLVIALWASVGTEGLAPGVAAQGERQIAVKVTRPMAADPADEGDICDFPNPDVEGVNEVLVVSNESGTVISTNRLVGAVEFTAAGDSLCSLDLTVDLPEAAYYVVRLGDEFVTAFAASEFPLDPTLDRIWIRLG